MKSKTFFGSSKITITSSGNHTKRSSVQHDVCFWARQRTEQSSVFYRGSVKRHFLRHSSRAQYAYRNQHIFISVHNTRTQSLSSEIYYRRRVGVNATRVREWAYAIIGPALTHTDRTLAERLSIVRR